MTNSATKILGLAIKAQVEIGVSMKFIAHHADCSYKTIYRILHGEIDQPDMDTISKLAAYFEIPIERLISSNDDAVTYFPAKSTPEIVDEFLRQDKCLSVEDAAKLSAIFSAAYGQFMSIERRVKV